MLLSNRQLIKSLPYVSYVRHLFFYCTRLLKSPMATGSPFGRSLAPWFGFENFQFFNFSIFSDFQSSDFRFFIIVIGFYRPLVDVHKISCKSVEGGRSYEGRTDGQTDTQTFILIGLVSWLESSFVLRQKRSADLQFSRHLPVTQYRFNNRTAQRKSFT